ncbi:nuclear transport factor 2 family protein [Chryseobacterium sp. CT-SW4]|uniref:nuclear transport factor 2 family protein n=1 Tax=Chryseobacterium sp. SW-1 TaxID=3157343 RepID=UPI003B025D94
MISLQKLIFILGLGFLFVSCSNDDHTVTQEPSRKEKAQLVLKSLETGDVSIANKYINATTYIQHNLDAADGRDSFIALLNSLKGSNLKVITSRTFEDKENNIVFLHTKYENLFGQTFIAFDAFRFDSNNTIVEHWDNLQEEQPLNPSNHSMIDGATQVKDLNKTESNRAIVKGFVNDVLIGGDFSVLENYISSTQYIQHNPWIADGIQGLQNGASILARYDILEVKKVWAEGNFVLVGSNITYENEPAVVYDLFRLENNKIVEHWDVLEMTPPQSQWQNNNGKF